MFEFLKSFVIVFLVGVVFITSPFMFIDNYNLATLGSVISFLVYCALLGLLVDEGIL
ncbi:hypothetical protein [Pseudoalteromonas phage PH357]|nr:hypothetical protein [Pseudoalteromonas phage PH357]